VDHSVRRIGTWDFCEQIIVGSSDGKFVWKYEAEKVQFKLVTDTAGRDKLYRSKLSESGEFLKPSFVLSYIQYEPRW